MAESSILLEQTEFLIDAEWVLRNDSAAPSCEVINRTLAALDALRL